jgi:hypothetical protein
VGRPVEEEAIVLDTVTEAERELRVLPLPVLDSLGLPVVVRTTDPVRDGEGEVVTVLTVNVTVTDLVMV